MTKDLLELCKKDGYKTEIIYDGVDEFSRDCYKIRLYDLENTGARITIRCNVDNLQAVVTKFFGE